ncbi:MAG: hypothetical protein QOE55_8172 [Acidobacteriaceae bacterium]|nr:hypothetical protein [Acidobacteriaceae bacterium]
MDVVDDSDDMSWFVSECRPSSRTENQQVFKRIARLPVFVRYLLAYNCNRKRRLVVAGCKTAPPQDGNLKSFKVAIRCLNVAGGSSKRQLRSAHLE